MPVSNQTRIVIDTNLWVSFIISKSAYKLDNLLLLNSILILFSEDLLDEISMTITKPKLKKYFPGNAIEEMLSAFENYIEFVNVTSKVKVCRDPKDDFLLALAKDGNAHFLITGDHDLLDLNVFGKTKITTFSDFLLDLTEV